MVSEIPNNQKEYLMFINSFTKNGIAKKQFSLSHARTLYLSAILLSGNIKKYNIGIRQKTNASGALQVYRFEVACGFLKLLATIFISGDIRRYTAFKN